MALMIKYTNQGVEHTAEILKNRGVCWLVRDAEGNEFNVQKKHVVCDWDSNAPAPSPLSLAGMALAAGAAAAPEAKPAKEKKAKAPAAEPEARDPNLVTLKELCFELDIQPRVARRMLRKAKGNIGTGSRWEWTKETVELAEVRRVLLKTE